MIEQLVPITLPPGYYNNGTTYQAKNRWLKGSLVRFWSGTMRPLGGWVAQTLTGASISGQPRAMLAYMKYDGTYLTVVGTTGGLYVIVYDPVADTRTVSDITPADLATALGGSDSAYNTAGGASPTDDRLTWSLSNFGDYVIASYQWENAPELIAASMGGVTLVVWDGVVTDVAAPSPNTIAEHPYVVLASFVTPEKFVVALGAEDLQNIITGADPDARMVWWPTQATTDDWYPSDINSAGSFSLPSSGTLKAGLPFRGQSLIWTTRDLWSMQYIGQPLIYSFQQIGLECGLISSHAFAATSNAVFWMGQNQFFKYDGFASPIPCDVSDYVFSDLNLDQRHLIWALHNPEFSEITWFYPPTGAMVADRYVTYNYLENHWVFGALTRTCGVTAQVPGLNPVMTDDTGVFYDHETGTVKGGAITYAESGPFELGAGDNVVRIQRIVPDDKTMGDVTFTLKTALFPDAAEQSHGPYAAANPTSVRATGRQGRWQIFEANAVAWRFGNPRLGIIVSGRR